MSDIQFVEIDPSKIRNDLISGYESASEDKLYPSDERRIFLDQEAVVVVGLKNNINESAKQNLLRYAKGSVLDAMGEFWDCPRLQPQKANTTFRFTLAAAQPNDVLIAAGKRGTVDGSLFFASTVDLVIPAGQLNGDVVAIATEAGEKYNNFAPGQIKTLVDPVPYVASIQNLDTSSGGADIEPDDDSVNVWSGYRERIRLAPGRLSTAGPEEAYIYWAKTADANIVDVSAQSLSPGAVEVVVLMADGGIPSQTILDKVLAAVSAKNRRPLTDNVSAVAPTVISYDINLTYYIDSGRSAEESTIRSAIEDSGGAIDKYIAWQYSRLDRDVNPDYLRQSMLNAGAFKIIMTSPVFTDVDPDEVAIIGIKTITYGGLI